MDEQAQGQFVHSVAFGERERFSHEAAQALAQGAVPTFDVTTSRPRLCRCSGGCGEGRLRRRPARSRCAWRGRGSWAGCAHARHGLHQQNDPRRSTPRFGASGGRGRSRPSERFAWNRRSSKARRVRARRPPGQEAACRLAAGALRLFFEPLGDRATRHAKDALGCP